MFTRYLSLHQGLLLGSTSSPPPSLDLPHFPTALVASTDYHYLVRDSRPPEGDPLLIGVRTLPATKLVVQAFDEGGTDHDMMLQMSGMGL